MLRKIVNKRTGEVREIDDQQASQFGLPAYGTQPTPQAQPMQPSPMPASPTPQFESGQPAFQSPQTPTRPTFDQIQEKKRKDIYNDMQTTGGKNITEIDAYYKTYDPSPEEVKRKDEQAKVDLKVKEEADKTLKAKDMIKSNAQSVLDVIDNKERYPSEEAYKEALSFAASNYNKQAFTEGGKSLTGSERSILSGGMINLTDQNPNILQRTGGFITGETPAIKSKVAEDDDTLRRKMLIAQGMKPEALGPRSGTEKPKEKNIVENAGQDIKDILNGIFNIPQAIGANYNEVVEQNGGRAPSQFQLAGNFAKNMATGYASNLNDDLGRPLEGGDVVGRAVDNFKEHPVRTVLDVLPIAQGAKALRGGSAVSNVSKAGMVDDVAQGGMRGKAATSVATPIADNVTLSENLMSDALKITKSPSVRGMAKELETFYQKVNPTIDDYVARIDKTIGNQPLEDVVTTIQDKLMQSPAGQARPDLVERFSKTLATSLDDGKVLENNGQLIDNSTNLTKFNETRKLMNRGLDSWIGGGKKIVSDADYISDFRYQTSRALKDLLGEADQSGFIKKAVGLQHSAMEVAPALAKEALKGATDVRGISTLLKRGFEEVINPTKAIIPRAMQGPADEITQQVMRGQAPDVVAPAATPEKVFTNTAAPVFAEPQTSAPGAIVDTPRTMYRDNRYKNWTPRK